MAAVEGAQAVGKDEVVDDARPEGVGHVEAFCGQKRKALEAEEGVGREDEGPDLVEVGVGEMEGLDHGGDVGQRGCGFGGWGDFTKGLEGAGTLPEDCLGVDVGEEGSCDLGEEGVEIVCGLGEGAGADGDLGDGVVSGGGFGDGPEERVVLVAGGETLGGGGESLGHAGREAEIDGERESR